VTAGAKAGSEARRQVVDGVGRDQPARASTVDHDVGEGLFGAERREGVRTPAHQCHLTAQRAAIEHVDAGIRRAAGGAEIEAVVSQREDRHLAHHEVAQGAKLGTRAGDGQAGGRARSIADGIEAARGHAGADTGVQRGVDQRARRDRQRTCAPVADLQAGRATAEFGAGARAGDGRGPVAEALAHVPAVALEQRAGQGLERTGPAIADGQHVAGEVEDA
jgi:hypothetical protein